MDYSNQFAKLMSWFYPMDPSYGAIKITIMSCFLLFHFHMVHLASWQQLILTLYLINLSWNTPTIQPIVWRKQWICLKSFQMIQKLILWKELCIQKHNRWSWVEGLWKERRYVTISLKILHRSKAMIKFIIDTPLISYILIISN